MMKLSVNAKIPVKGSSDSAGLDLFSAHNACVPAWGKVLIQTDLSFEFPSNCYGRIAARSGLALYKNIFTVAGVIDR